MKEDGPSKYLLDAYNNWIFEIQDDGSLKQISKDSIDNLINNHYEDSKNVEGINKILSKYYHLNSLGITNVYDYRY